MSLAPFTPKGSEPDFLKDFSFTPMKRVCFESSFSDRAQKSFDSPVDQMDGDGRQNEGEDLADRAGKGLSDDLRNAVGHEKYCKEEQHVHGEACQGPGNGKPFGECEGGREGRRTGDQGNPEWNGSDRSWGSRNLGGPRGSLVFQEIGNGEDQEEYSTRQSKVPEGQPQKIQQGGPENIEEQNGQKGGQHRRPGGFSFLGSLHPLC